MNKYELAFEKVKEACVSFDTVDELITLKELVEKATPKKVTIHKTPYNYIEFECPSCHETTHTNFVRPYCGECGQALDWGEEDVD